MELEGGREGGSYLHNIMTKEISMYDKPIRQTTLPIRYLLLTHVCFPSTGCRTEPL